MNSLSKNIKTTAWRLFKLQGEFFISIHPDLQFYILIYKDSLKNPIAL